MSSQVALIVFGFVVLPIVCIACERLWPSVLAKPFFRRDFASDVIWYFVQTFVSRTIAPWVVYCVLLTLLPAAGISIWWQVPIVFIAADVLSYWQHTPLLVLGFSPMAFLVQVPFTASYAVFLHANVNWSFGPLRYMVASPVCHRWHHTARTEGRDRNCSGVLPVWDLLFGTFYMPAGRAPDSFGVDERVPSGFLKQLAYAFAGRRAKEQALSAAPP